jgi:ligand-binding SRPBCC domain-containing protein
MRLWHHKHFIKEIPGGVEMEDIVDYKVPMGIIRSISASVSWYKPKLR